MSKAPSPINKQAPLFDDGDPGFDIESLVNRVEGRPLVRSRKKILAFGWYGGKFSHLDWLLPLLPPCHHYIEPFGGSAAILLNREPSPIETYNDIDGEVVNFFRVLRTNTDELIKVISLTPFSREEFFIACQPLERGISSLERARRFFVRARQVRTGLAQTASLGRWANCKNTSRAGMSGVVSRWLGGVENLDRIALRLLRVQIENRPWDEVIQLYDDPGALFYCDPPYVHDVRGDSKAYAYEFSNQDHENLAKRLRTIKGRAIVSGYESKLYRRLYDGWRCLKAPAKTCHSTKKERQEYLWFNFP